MTDYSAPLLILSIPSFIRLLYAAFIVAMLIAASQISIFVMVTWGIFAALYWDNHLFKVVLTEKGIEVHKLWRKHFLRWDQIVRVETIVGRTIIFTSIYNINIPRLILTNSHTSYKKAVKIIREYV